MSKYQPDAVAISADDHKYAALFFDKVYPIQSSYEVPEEVVFYQPIELNFGSVYLTEDEHGNIIDLEDGLNESLTEGRTRDRHDCSGRLPVTAGMAKAGLFKVVDGIADGCCSGAEGLGECSDQAPASVTLRLDCRVSLLSHAKRCRRASHGLGSLPPQSIFVSRIWHSRPLRTRGAPPYLWLASCRCCQGQGGSWRTHGIRDAERDSHI